VTLDLPPPTRCFTVIGRSEHGPTRCAKVVLAQLMKVLRL
jgi:hypothetical protein